ncbi:carboxy-S-adenosyl-L-methionine synthase CmoA [Paraferrimonas haliotis]|uniref:carboxy-S-adenosyl-L-methionine synthase CmoA n=1 Tax=Paraferrimonas haliotis TaxID=2013866 RepID=UPI000BA97EEC|nr:carboxy-S-adenosyl-L-methionine synthase CmoA [Paraferrimonas haliotis]
MSKGSDQIYANPQKNIADFSFDKKVVEVFPDMISRSVPGYGDIVQGIGNIAKQVVTSGSQVYDLGCSLGAATLAIRRQIEGKQAKIIAIDNSPSMVERCQTHLDAFVSSTPVELQCADIREIKISNASLVVLNFTLQFLPPADRLQLLSTIYEGLNTGGCIVVSEKLYFKQGQIQALIDSLHLDFKRANGYSELEISQKRSALENVMKPDSIEQHFARFSDAGFKQYHSWYQRYNFCSMVAIK